MGDKITLIAAGVAFVLLIVGVWSNSWWTASMMGTDIDFGLRELAVCTMDKCRYVSYGAGRIGGGGAVFKMFGTMTFVVGFVAAFGVAVAAFFHVFHGLDRFRKIAGPACLTMIPLSLITLLSFPGPEGMSIGWAVGAVILGAIAGAYSSFRQGADSWNVGEYKPVRIGPAVDEDGLAPLPQTDGSGLAPIPGDGAVASEAVATEAPSHDDGGVAVGSGGGGGAAAAAIGLAAGGNAAFARPLFGDAPSQTGGAAVAPQAASESPAAAATAPITLQPTTTAKLRYLAKQVEISSVGISAVLAAGGQRDLLWDDIRRVSARALPPAPPYNGAVFIDLLPVPLLGRPSPPIRLTTSSTIQVDPDLGASGGDILREIGVLVERHKPGVVESSSQSYFTAGGAPQSIPDEPALTGYDEQFGGGSYGR